MIPTSRRFQTCGRFWTPKVTLFSYFVVPQRGMTVYERISYEKSNSNCNSFISVFEPKEDNTTPDHLIDCFAYRLIFCS